MLASMEFLSPSPCILQGSVLYFANISAKTKQFSKKVFSVDQRPLWVRFIKEEKKSRDTAAQQFRPNLEQLEVVSF